MPRKKCVRHVGHAPDVTYYKPAGIPLRLLDEVIVHLDEIEALRLADKEGLYQDAAAEKMNISRQTFGRILDEAHRKIADALTTGKSIRIEGGHIQVKLVAEQDEMLHDRRRRNRERDE